MKNISVRKAKKILQKTGHLYRRKKKKLDQGVQKKFEDCFLSLGSAIQEKNRDECQNQTSKLEELSKTYLKRSSFQKFIDIAGGIAIALLIAIVIRQVWFEFYNIPTGSMRPTFKEKDYLVVSKTAFSLNIPLKNQHLYFNEDLFKRGNIVIFSGDKMSIPDVDTRYFFIFPGKKQYIKRLIGKPGDTLYFYGGKVYGVDIDGKEIEDFYEKPWFDQIEHIPFIRFEGKVITPSITPNGVFSPVYIYQMNEPVAKLTSTAYGKLDGEMLTTNAVKDYSNLWGFHNYATARILTYDQVEQLTDVNVNSLEKAPLYLELTHHPKINPLNLIKDEYSRMRPALSYSRSIIPLQQEHIESIFAHITTARFIVKDGIAYRYGHRPTSFSIPLANVPNGIYEFDNGVLYKIQADSLLVRAPNFLKQIFNILPIGGFLQKMPNDHPLYDLSKKRIQLLYNIGIEWDSRFQPRKKYQLLNPSRYAYFRNKDLYLLGHPIFKEHDVQLQSFLAAELQKEMDSLSYQAFVDQGPPFLDTGELDIKLVMDTGLQIPENGYLALGDNHAMSSDTRDFGFVPQQNLKGGASFVFWPIGRWGFPSQPNYPILSFPKIFVWTTFIIVLIGLIILYKKRKMY